MQASKCLELKISTEAIEKAQFEQLATQFQTLGNAEETDIDSNSSYYIAWLPYEDSNSIQNRVAAACKEAGIAPQNFTLKFLEPQNWETAWQKDWHGMAIGENLWVRPSFCDQNENGRIDIVLDPGMAFGTGTHPTTQLCLEAIERICKQPNMPKNLLDMGAGSGILAIAALKLGAEQAITIDMEEDSVAACNTNAAINGVVLQAVLDDTPPAQQFDLVVANILAAPLVWMAKELAPCVRNRLILSGLLAAQVDDVVAAYTAEGLQEVRRDQQQEWASVELIPIA